MKKLILLALLIIMGCEEDPIGGCIDANALNYDSNAEEDNGSCEYLPFYGYDDYETTSDPDVIFPVTTLINFILLKIYQCILITIFIQKRMQPRNLKILV